MNPFGLIIQETTSGLNVQYASQGLDINLPEIKETITDERMLASQLANQSDVYSIQITKNYKVYSLIVTNITDFVGRAGFYAIRLYTPKSLNLINFESILETINQKYLGFKNNGPIHNQDYSDILSTILQLPDENNNFIGMPNKVTYFYYFDPTNTNLSTVFNVPAVHLTGKIYAFNNQKSADKNIALQSGLQSFNSLNHSIKRIQIDTNGILKELKINEKSIEFNNFIPNVNLICNNEDVITYNTIDDKNFRQITNSYISLQRKHIPPLRMQPVLKEKSIWKKYENPILISVCTLLIITIGYVGYTEFYPDKPQDPVNTTGSVAKAEPEKKSVQDTTVTFKKFVNPNPGRKDSIYKSDYEHFKKYSFIFAGTKWSYNDLSNQTYRDFNLETIANFKLSKNDGILLVNELKKASGKEITNKEKKTEKTDVKPQDKSGIKSSKLNNNTSSKPQTASGENSGDKIVNPNI